jgi:hypothetical protein
LLIANVDGLPLQEAFKLISIRDKFRFVSVFHIWLHAKFQSKQRGDSSSAPAKLPVKNLKLLLISIRNAIAKLSIPDKKTYWSNYYSKSVSYSKTAFADKEKILTSLLKTCEGSVGDIGANEGHFSLLAAAQGLKVTAFEADVVLCDKLYKNTLRLNVDLLTVNVDLFNPSPSLGWLNKERDSFFSRFSFDNIMALGLIHHLVLKHINFEYLLDFFKAVTKQKLILEFIPADDPQFISLCSVHRKTFEWYHMQGLIQRFNSDFRLLNAYPVHDSKRTVLVFEKIS